MRLPHAVFKKPASPGVEAPKEDEIQRLAREQLNAVHQPEVLCCGSPKMLSDLARWAKAHVDAEEWLERHTPKKCYVFNRTLQAWSDYLAFRRSKDVDDKDDAAEGPAWGSTVVGYDEGDGWLCIAEGCYLPMALDGEAVLHSGIKDGPALTEDGHALDLDEGTPVYFSCSKETSAGDQEAKNIKSARRAKKAVAHARLARDAAASIEDGESCALSQDGVVHGALPAPKQLAERRVNRLKALHRSRIASRAAEEKVPVLCVGPTGRVFIDLHLADNSHKEERRWLLSQRVQSTSFDDTVLAVDLAGTVQEFP